MNSPSLTPPVRDGHVKRRKALQLLADMDAAEIEFCAASKKLAVSMCRLQLYTAALRERFERAVAAGRGPVDSYGDPLYGTCRKCGKLIERYKTFSEGERLGMGWATNRHICKGRKS